MHRPQEGVKLNKTNEEFQSIPKEPLVDLIKIKELEVVNKNLDFNDKTLISKECEIKN